MRPASSPLGRAVRHGRAALFLVLAVLAGAGPGAARAAAFTVIPNSERLSNLAAPRSPLGAEPLLRLGSAADAGAINGIAADPSGRFVAVATSLKTVELRAIDGRLLNTLRPPSDAGSFGNVMRVAINRNADTVAVSWRGAKSGSVYLFDRATGAVRRHIDDLPDLAGDLQFSPDGSLLAYAVVTGGLLLFDAASGRELGRDLSYGGDSYSVDFSQDGRRIVTTSFDGNLRLYAVDHGAVQKTGQFPARPAGGLGNSKPINARFSPDGKWVAVGFNFLGGVAIHEAASLKYVGPLDTRTLRANLPFIGWSTDGAYLYATTYRDDLGKVVVRRWNFAGRWSPVGPEFVDYPITGHGALLLGPIGLPGGDLLVSTTDSSWGVLTSRGEVEWRHANGNAKPGFYVITAFHPPLLAVSPHGDRVAVGDAYDAQAAPWSFDLNSRALGAGLQGTDLPRVDGPGFTINRDEIERNGGRGPIRVGEAAIETGASERVTSLALAADGGLAAVATTEMLRLVERSGRVRWQQPGFHVAVNVTADGRWVVARTKDDIVHWLRAADGKEMMSLYLHSDGRRWILWTPTGYFGAESAADDFVGWQVNRGLDAAADFYPLSRFRRAYFRPDLFGYLVASGDEAQALRQADLASARTDAAPPVAGVLPPALELVDAPVSFAESRVVVRLRVRTAPDAPVEGFDTRVNGAFVPKPRGIQRAQGDVTTLEVPVPQADAQVEIFARNRHGVSEPLQLTLQYQRGAGTAVRRQNSSTRKPHLYVLAVGVSRYAQPGLALKYAGIDAREFERMFELQRGHYYSEVTARLLVDGEATRAQVLAGLAWLSQITTDSDVGIVFLAGHAFQLPDGSYHFAPSDFDPANVRGTGVDDESIQAALRTFSTKGNHALLFVDTCHAGAVAGVNLVASTGDHSNSILAERENSVVVFAASSGNRLALEDAVWGHGAFTKVLLEGLGDWKADREESGEINHADLAAYVQKHVPALTRQQQIPRVMTPPGGVDPIVVMAR